MKKTLLLFLSLLLSAGILSSCQRHDPPSSEPTDSTPDTYAEDTTPPPSANTPEDTPMENISTYQNPILTSQTENAWSGYGFGDPFVMRHNGVYYLYVSTKDGSVGVRCWSSLDLVNWSFEGFCTNDPITRGAYAPEVYYYNGYFYMYTSPAGNGHYVLRSTSPVKGFEPVTGNMGMSIDGSVFMDHDGKWYFYTAGHGAIQIYNMSSPTQMTGGRPLSTVSVNGGWTEGSMVVYHDGYYYITYTGNHVLSPSYRILYGVSADSPTRFDGVGEQNPLLISTEEAVLGIGHSSTVKGPDLDSYYIVYHSLVNTLPNRNMNIDRIWFNGERMEILGPTTDPQQVPAMPHVYHHFAPGSSLKGWSLEGALGSGGEGLRLKADSRLIAKTPFDGDFTAEYTVTSISEGGMAGAVFGYTDAENFGACYFSPEEQKVIIEITVAGETSVKSVNTIRSFGEDTRFDCLQTLQIERCGKDYTFYMNDRLLCVIPDSALAGGSIGYITKGADATFGFIGGTQAVGGRGGADAFKTVSEQGGVIPAVEAIESHETIAWSNGGKVIAVGAGDTLTYRILAASDGAYDLSVLCHGIGEDGAKVSVCIDGRSVGTASLPSPEGGTATLIHRGIPLTEGQHRLTLTFESDVSVERLRLLKAAPIGEISLDDPHFSDGTWNHAGDSLSVSPPSPFGKRLYGSPNMGDYTVEVAVTPKAAPNCGLLVRATAPGAPNFMGTSPDSQDTVTATDWVKGYFVGLASDGVIIGKQSYSYREVAHAEGQFRANQTYRLKVICEGARILVYVDGVLYLDYTDPFPYMQGMVGVRVPNCPAVFRDLTISSSADSAD